VANPLTIFSGSDGLNVKVDPVRLPFSKETGVQDLAVAYNVDHDSTGRVSRRKGFAATVRTENIHSLWCDGGPAFFVTGTSLCLLNADYTYKVLRSVTSGARMRYLQVGGRTYYTNGHEQGYIENQADQAWQVPSEVYGPDTDRVFSDPPLGSRLAIYNAHIFVVQGDVVWHSEPFGYNLFDLARNFLSFESEVRMFRPVRNGIFASSSHSTYFLRGNVPRDLNLEKVADFPAISDTDTEIDAARVGGGEYMGMGISAMWTGTEGICLGISDGRFINLTRRKLDFPSAVRGSGLALDDRYLALLEP
jgi:hypothetical protein